MRRRSAAATPKAPATAARSAAVVVSSTLTDTVSASTRRMLTPRVEGGGDDLVGAAGHGHRAAVSKKASSTTSTPPSRRTAASTRPVAWTRSAIAAQAVGAVVDGVHARHDGEQHLGGADVARRLLAADVLLAGLQGEPVGRVRRRRRRRRRRGGRAGSARGPARTPCSRRAGRRSPSARRSAGWTRPRRRRPTPPAASSRVRASRSAATVTSAPRVVRRLGERPAVADRAVGAGVLHEDAEDVGAAGGARTSASAPDRSASTTLDAERLARVREDGDGLREDVGVDDEHGVGRRPWTARRMSVIASAAAVPSSSREAPAIASPVRSVTTSGS